MSTLATLTVKILGDTGHLTSSLERAQKKSKSFTEGLRKARGPLLALTGATVGLGLIAVKTYGDFDAAMTQSLAIMGDVSETMRGEMVAAAEEVGRKTTFSARDAAESFFFLASAGLDAQASITALRPVAKFAQAGMFDMALATDLLTDAQSALGLTIRDDAVANMENMVRVSDTLVKANTLANASVQQFSEALTQKAGAALRLVGKDVEEGVAVLAAFADQGIKGAEAGTQLGIVMRDLQTKAIRNRKEFAAMNVSVFDARGEMRNFADILGDLEGALAGASDETKKATLLNLGFSDKSVAALQAIIGMSGAIAEYEIKLRSAGGATQEVADKQLAGFNAQLKIAKDRASIAASHLGEKFAPAVLKLVGVLTLAVEWFSKLDGKAVAVIAGIIALTGGLAVLGLMIPPLVTGFGLLSAAFGVAGSVGALFTVSLWAQVAAWIALNAVTGGIIIGFGLLVVAIVAIATHWDTFVRGVTIGANLLIAGIELMVNIWLLQINIFIKALNAVGKFVGIHVDEILVHFGRFEVGAQAMADTTVEAYEDIITGGARLGTMVTGVVDRVVGDFERLTGSLNLSGFFVSEAEQMGESFDLMAVDFNDLVAEIEAGRQKITGDAMAALKNQQVVADNRVEIERVAGEQIALAEAEALQARIDEIGKFRDKQKQIAQDTFDFRMELREAEVVEGIRLLALENDAIEATATRNAAAFAAVLAKVAQLPSQIRSNINQGVASFGGLTSEFFSGFGGSGQLVLNPIVGSDTAHGFNQAGERVELVPRSTSPRRQAEIEENERLRRQVIIENININTPAVIGENATEVVATLVRDGIDRGLIEVGLADE